MLVSPKRNDMFLLRVRVLVLVFFCSCAGEKSLERDDFVAETTLQFSEKPYDVNLVGELLEDLNLIVLETNDASLIGEIEKIETNSNKIYIHDGQSHSILVFKKDGAFDFRLNMRGRGPGEYLHLRDFYIDKISNEIVILGAPNKVMRFSERGKFLSQSLLNFFPLKFKQMPQCYVFWNGRNSEGNPMVTVTNLCFEIINEHFPHTDGGFVTSKVMFSEYDSELYLRPFLNKYWNYVFSIDLNDIKLKYLIDFGKFNWPPDQYAKMRTSPYTNQGYFYQIDDFFELDKWVVFKVTRNRTFHNGVFNKETGDSFWWQSNFKRNIPATIFQNVISKCDNRFYSAIETSVLIDNIDVYNEAYAKYGWPENSTPFGEIMEIIKSSSIEDNPVIFSFSMK